MITESQVKPDERTLGIETSEPGSIGVAISGGGHRATAYALGVLLYLVDSGLSQKVQTITSVSGGSILNAYIALLRSADGHEKKSFNSFKPGEFDPHVAQLASLLSGNRRMWFASIGLALGGTGLSLILFLLSVIDATTTLLLTALLLMTVAFLSGPRSGGSLWGWPGTWLYCGVLVWLGTIEVVIFSTASYRVTAIVILTILIGWLFQQRHWVAERAYEYTICRPLLKRRRWSATRAHLEDMNTDVKHVFCATEMHSGQHAYFSHDFVYARGFGLGRPSSLPVAAAVQVSANFPGGFPIRPLRASRFEFSLTDRFEDAVEQGFNQGRDILMPDEDVDWAVAHNEFAPMRALPKWLMLSDGGVFDNLAVDWYLQNQNRLTRLKMTLNWDFDTAAGGWVDSETNSRDESILLPLKDSPELLIVVNAGVTAHWQRSSSKIVSLPFIGEAVGLSQISATMYNNYTKERIQALQQALVIEMGFSERLVRTTLLPLGTQVTARLIRAGYSEVMRAAARRFGHPLLEVNDEDFALFAQGKHGKRTRKLFSLGNL